MKLVPSGGKWRWLWGDWSSAEFEFLEDRPWTPALISGKLCFSARDAKRWRIVWGDALGKSYDDVYDLDAFEGHPVYVAWDSGKCFLVWGVRESQGFGFQITFRIEDGDVRIYRFDGKRGAADRLDPPEWRPA